jgi:hypothetical protein
MLLASIYATYFFTIIAASGSDDEYGLPGIVLERNVSRTILSFNGIRLALYDYAWEENKETWHTRAWTFQERLVSRRRLIFYRNTVKWECDVTVWHELIQSPKPSTHRTSEYQLKHSAWPNWDQYTELVAGYAPRRLTYQKDAMNAFLAIIKCLEPSLSSGFLFCVSEFFFSWALFMSAGSKTRRNEFPSWTWLGW